MYKVGIFFFILFIHCIDQRFVRCPAQIQMTKIRDEKVGSYSQGARVWKSRETSILIIAKCGKCHDMLKGAKWKAKEFSRRTPMGH